VRLITRSLLAPAISASFTKLPLAQRQHLAADDTPRSASSTPSPG
jgi:hypothetical protein